MTLALRRPVTEAEFLAWEQDQPERWEFDGFGPVATVGGTAGHSAPCANIIGALYARLRGTPRRACAGGLKVRTAAGSARYPDIIVSRGDQDGSAPFAEAPAVVFEVLSPSASHVDHALRNAEYRATPSIRRYVMLAQDRPAATVYERRGADWVGTLHAEADAVLAMPQVGTTLPLAELYEGVLA